MNIFNLFGKKSVLTLNSNGQIITQDAKIKQLLLEKQKLIRDGRKCSTQIEELANKRNKLALRVQKIKDKVMPFAKRIKKEKLGKYEDIQSIELVGKNIVVKTFNYLDEYKRQLEIRIKKGEL